MKEVPDVYAESLYGRGLAYLDLGELARARATISAPRPACHAPPRKAKAGARRGGAPRERQARAAAAGHGSEMLLDKLADGLPKASADPAAEKDVTTLARGLAARGGDWPAQGAGRRDEEARRRHPGRRALELRPLPPRSARRRPHALRRRRPAGRRGRGSEGRRPRALAPRAALPRRRLPAERGQVGGGRRRSSRSWSASSPTRRARARRRTTASARSTSRARRTRRAAPRSRTRSPPT